MTQKFEAYADIVDGVVKPTFKVEGWWEDKNGDKVQYTSGYLKYFNKYNGKRVKVTIEVLEDV